MKYLFIALMSLALLGCKKKGCTDPLAVNYDASAEKNEGCTYPNFTLYLLEEDAVQYMNDGVLGFILKTKDGLSNEAPSAFHNVNLFIDVNNSTSVIPSCGDGVWSYYEDASSYYHGWVLSLYNVTATDTVFNRSVVVGYASMDSNFNPVSCSKQSIYY